MPFSYQIDASKRVARITVSGILSPETIWERTLTVVRDIAWVPGMRMLIDLTDVEHFDADSADVLAIVGLFSDLRDRLGLGEVILLDPREDFRRLYQLYAATSEIGELPPVHLAATAEEAEALLNESGRR